MKQLKELASASSEAVKLIAEAANKATSAIASAASDAAKLLATNAAEAVKVANTKDTGDHDLIIGLVKDVATLQGAVNRMLALEEKYINREDFAIHQKKDDDHENRIRVLEGVVEDFATIKRIVFGATGIILVGVFTSIVYLVVK